MKKSLLIGALALSSILSADYLLEYKMGEDTQKFMYHDASTARLIMPSDDASSIYKIGKKSYIVSGRGKNKKIVDVDAMRAMANSFGYDPSEYNQEEQFHPQIKKTSKRVTVAGIRGEVWRVSAEDGAEFEDIVVTKDKRVVHTMRAMQNLFENMSGIKADSSMLEIEKGYVVIQADGLKLNKFKEMSIDASEYALPTDAKKQEMPHFNKKNMKALEDRLAELAKESEKMQEKTQKSQKDEEKIDADKAVDMLKSFF